MTEPQPGRFDQGHLPPSPYSFEEIEFLRESWGITPRQTEMLQLLLAWKIPKQIALVMGIETVTVRHMIDEVRARARICDGADGIKEEAAKWIARKRADPQLHRDVWWDEHERPEDWEEN